MEEYERFKRALSRGNYPSIETIEKWITASFTVQKINYSQFIELMSTVRAIKEGVNHE